MDVDSLKSKSKITRDDIAQLLKSLGKPGENQDEKIAAVEKLGLKNPSTLGGHGVHLTLETFGEF